MKIGSDHYIDGVQRVSTNKHGGEITPLFLVMHFTSGWSTLGDIATLSKDPTPASAHIVLSREGTCYQLIPFNKKAWHVGPSASHGYKMLNDMSIGLEISNIGYVKELSDGSFMDEYGNRIDADGKFKNSGRVTSSPPSTWHEQYHPRLAHGARYRWEPYDERQLAYLDNLVPAILAKYPTIRWIVSHEEVDTRGWKTDPGFMFPMKRYTKLLDDKSVSLGDIVFRVTVNQLNVRSGPSVKADAFDYLNKGQVVTEVDASGDWTHVKYDGDKDGWVATRYLQPLA